jgi:2-iminobutanoate/2-iminopropanoate deaminase
MAHTLHNIGVSKPIGIYSDAAEVAANVRWLITAQAELAWQHIVSAYASVRAKYLGDARPASMLSVVSQLVWPNTLVEIEIIAAKAFG